jgi:hypothetical protein
VSVYVKCERRIAQWEALSPDVRTYLTAKWWAGSRMGAEGACPRCGSWDTGTFGADAGYEQTDDFNRTDADLADAAECVACHWTSDRPLWEAEEERLRECAASPSHAPGAARRLDLYRAAILKHREMRRTAAIALLKGEPGVPAAIGLAALLASSG